MCLRCARSSGVRVQRCERGGRRQYRERSTTHATPRGAILDIGHDMNRVACTVSEVSGAILDERRKKRSGTNSHEVEKFPLHVFVVDDEPLIRWSVAESLATAGYIVEQAADAASALKIVADTPLRFQVVVMDLRLPDMHDLSLLATFRQVWPDARVILMTAFGTPEILAEARRLGAEVLNKPFELDELNHLVQSP